MIWNIVICRFSPVHFKSEVGGADAECRVGIEEVVGSNLGYV